MKSKFLWLAFLILTGMLGFQVVRLLTFPFPSRDLILNEESFLERTSELEVIELLRHYEHMKHEAGSGVHPRIQKYITNGQLTIDMIGAGNESLSKILALKDRPDSLGKYIDFLNGQIRQLSKFTEGGHYFEGEDTLKFSDLSVDTILNAPGELRGIAVARLHLAITANYMAAMDEYSKYVGATAIKFDTWQSALMKDKTSDEWIKGIIAFNTPRVMKLDQKERIQVRISRNFASGMVETLKNNGSATVDSVMTGNIMMVKLTGEDFKITAFDEEEQGVTEDGYTQWEFDVTPQSSGDHDLYMKVGIVYFIPNLGPTKKYFPVYEKKIEVKVDVWQQVAGFAVNRWEFIVSTLVIPAGAWLIARWRKRREDEKNKAKAL